MLHSGEKSHSKLASLKDASKGFKTASSGRFRRFSCIYNLSRPAPVTGEGANKKIKHPVVENRIGVFLTLVPGCRSLHKTKSRSISTVEGSGATCTRIFFELFFQNR